MIPLAAIVCGLLGYAQAAGAPEQAPAPGVDDSWIVRAIEKQNLPWYDPSTGRFQPAGLVKAREPGRLQELFERGLERVRSGLRMLLDPISNLMRRIGRGLSRLSLGGAFATAGLFAILFGLLVWLARTWGVRGERVRRSSPISLSTNPARVLEAAAVESWTESELLLLARKHRGAGDLASAIVALFACQLVRLERAGTIRFAPGRTARQYVREAQKVGRANVLAESLLLFESVSYGRRSPARADFERVWHAVVESRDPEPGARA